MAGDAITRNAVEAACKEVYCDERQAYFEKSYLQDVRYYAKVADEVVSDTTSSAGAVYGVACLAGQASYNHHEEWDGLMFICGLLDGVA